MFSTKLESVGDMKRDLAPDMEMLSFGFAQLFFNIVLVQYFLMLLFIPSGAVMFILCHCVLEVCDL